MSRVHHHETNHLPLGWAREVGIITLDERERVRFGVCARVTGLPSRVHPNDGSGDRAKGWGQG